MSQNLQIQEKYPLVQAYRKHNKQNEIPASPGSNLQYPQTMSTANPYLRNDSTQLQKKRKPREEIQEENMMADHYDFVNDQPISDEALLGGGQNFSQAEQLYMNQSQIQQQQQQYQRSQSPTPATYATQTSQNQELGKFKKDLLAILGKFGGQHTSTQAANELKTFMKNDITDNDRMIILLNSLGALTEHMNLNQIKMQIQQFGVAAEIFDEALIPFLPRVLSAFTKKIKEEGSNRLHIVISETMGQLVWNILDKVEDQEQQLDIFENQLMKHPLAILDKSTNKVQQQGAIACLTKIIINSPDDILFDKLDSITDRIVGIFKTKLFQAQQQLLECLISIIFHIQEEFKHYYQKFLPIFVDIIQKTKDTNTKRVAIDAIYSIGAHLTNEVLEYKDELIGILDKCRTDKSQPVRAAAQETLKLLKELDQNNQRSFSDSDYGENMQNQEINEEGGYLHTHNQTVIEQNRLDVPKQLNTNRYLNDSRDQLSEQNLAPPTQRQRGLTAQSSLGQLKQIKPYDRCRSPNLNLKKVKSGTASTNDLYQRPAHKSMIETQEPAEKYVNPKKKTMTKSNSRAAMKSPNDRVNRARKGSEKGIRNLTPTDAGQTPEYNEQKRQRLPPGLKKAPGKPSRSPIPNKKEKHEMSHGEIEQTHDLLLNDPNYTRDKTVKKVSLATLKRRKQQLDEKERQASPSKQAAKARQGDKPQSLAEMKEMYKNQRNAQQTNQEIENFIVMPAAKKEYKSIFQQQLNGNFSKENEVDEIEIMVTEKPKGLQDQLDLQKEAYDRFKQKQVEDEQKFQGLTPFERKRLILKELKEAEKGGTQSATPAAAQPPVAPERIQTTKKRNSKVPKQPKKQNKVEPKEWNFDTEIPENEAPAETEKKEQAISWLGTEETKKDEQPSGIDWLSGKDKEVKPWKDNDDRELKKEGSTAIAWLGANETDMKQNNPGETHDNTLNLDGFEDENTITGQYTGNNSEIQDATWVDRYHQNIKKKNQHEQILQNNIENTNSWDNDKVDLSNKRNRQMKSQFSDQKPVIQVEKFEDSELYKDMSNQMSQLKTQQEMMMENLSQFSNLITNMSSKMENMEQIISQLKIQNQSLQADLYEQKQMRNLQQANPYQSQTMQSQQVYNQNDSQYLSGQIQRQLQQMQTPQPQKRDSLQNQLDMIQMMQQSQQPHEVAQPNKSTADQLIETLLLKNKLQQAQEQQSNNLNSSQTLAQALARERAEQAVQAQAQNQLQTMSTPKHEHKPSSQDALLLSSLLSKMGNQQIDTGNSNQIQMLQKLLDQKKKEEEETQQRDLINKLTNSVMQSPTPSTKQIGMNDYTPHQSSQYDQNQHRDLEQILGNLMNKQIEKDQ